MILYNPQPKLPEQNRDHLMQRLSCFCRLSANVISHETTINSSLFFLLSLFLCTFVP